MIVREWWPEQKAGQMVRTARVRLTIQALLIPWLEARGAREYWEPEPGKYGLVISRDGRILAHIFLEAGER